MKHSFFFRPTIRGGAWHPAHGKRCRGFTLVEVIVLMLVTGLLGVLLMRLRSQGARRIHQIEAGTDQVRAALLLRRYLRRDLSACLARSVLSPDELALDEKETELVLPLFGGYQGDKNPALQYRPLRYRWVGGEGLYRGRKVVLGQGLSRVRFAWSEGDRRLEATLVSLRDKTPELTLVFPLVVGSHWDGWIRAPHHRGASLAP
jgi:type II secretory pathway component PulJ